MSLIDLAWEILLVKVPPATQGHATRGVALAHGRVCGWLVLGPGPFLPGSLGPILAGLSTLLCSALRQFHGAWGRLFSFFLASEDILFYFYAPVLWLAVRMVSAPGSDGAGNKIRRQSIVCRIVACQFNAAHLHVEIGPLSTSCY